MNGNGEHVLLLGAVLLCLVDYFDHAPRDLGNLALDGGPTVVLELRYLDGVLRFTVCYRKLALGVVGTALTLDVRYEQILVLHLLVGPVPGTLAGTVANL